MTKTIQPREGKQLLKIARDSIQHSLAGETLPILVLEEYPPELREKGASFVTLKLDGVLRGCIGSIQATDPLVVDVQERAVAACEELAARHRRQTVVAVTHADVIKAVVAHFVGAPLDQFQRIGASPTSVSVLDLPADGIPRVVAVNTNGDPDTWR